MSKWKGLFLQRCPCCVEASAFSGLFKMNDECARCGLRFEPEPGYYAGALYISYALALILVAPLSLWMMYNDYSAFAIIAASILVLAPLSPLFFRYSRLMWI